MSAEHSPQHHDTELEAAVYAAIDAPDADKHHFRDFQFRHLIEHAQEAIDTVRHDRHAAATQEDIVELAVGKSFHGHPLPAWHRYGGDHLLVPMVYKDHMHYRRALIDVAVSSPQTAESLVAHNIIGLHGSGSAGLVSMLRYGLQSLTTLRERGIPIHTGAKDALGASVQAATSFLPVHTSSMSGVSTYAGGPLTVEVATKALRDLDEAHTFDDQYEQSLMLQLLRTRIDQNRSEWQATMDYLKTPPATAAEAQQLRLVAENYPLVWALSARSIDAHQVAKPRGLPGEFLVSKLTREDTPLLFVPSAKIAEVRSLAERESSPVEILAIEDFAPLAEKLGDRLPSPKPGESGHASEQQLSMRGVWSAIRNKLR